MNKVLLCGRLTKEPEVRYTDTKNGSLCIARYTLAVDRRGKDAGTDFISCVAMGKNGEFAEKYVTKGTKLLVCGRIQTGSYTKRDGTKAYTIDVIVDEQEFAESKKTSEAPKTEAAADDWTTVPDDIDDAGLPWN